MEALLVASCSAQPKSHRVEYPLCTCFGHKSETVAGHVLCGHIQGAFIIAWLTYNKPKSQTRKICAENSQFAMIKTMKAWIGEDGFLQVLECRVGLLCPQESNRFGILVS
jgi:hypothetical protein